MNKTTRRKPTDTPIEVERSFQIGDPVIATDPVFIKYQERCTPKERPSNEGIVLEIWKDGEVLLVQFPIGNYDIDKQSHVSPFFVETVKLNTNG